MCNSKSRKYQACHCQNSNEFVKFLISFHSFFLLCFSAPVDDYFLMCKRSMCVNRFIVISQALDEFSSFLFWHQTLHVSGTHITRMRTAYYFLQHCFQICAQCLFGHSSHNYYVEMGGNSIFLKSPVFILF